MTTIDFTTDHGGDLILYERALDRESLIDRNVQRPSITHHSAWEHPFLLYTVQHPDRAGVWIARLSALPETGAQKASDAKGGYDAR